MANTFTSLHYHVICDEVTYDERYLWD